MKLENDKVIMVMDDGSEKEYEVMFTFDYPANGKSYVAFSDNVVTNGKREINFVCYETGAYTGDLYPVDEEDADILKHATEEVNKQLEKRS